MLSRHTTAFRDRPWYVRTLAILLVNVVILVSGFAVLEIGFRVHRAGVRQAFQELASGTSSASAEQVWVIADDALGYRLNPDTAGINERSIRHGGIAVPKPADLTRVIYLGDSLPFDPDGFVSMTRRRLGGSANIEVVNASTPGYTSYQEVLFYERYLADTSPDLVIWTYCLNDNHRFLLWFDERAQMLLTDEAKATLLGDSTWGAWLDRSQVLVRIRLALLGLSRRVSRQQETFEWDNLVAFRSAWDEDSWVEYEQHLLRLKGSLDAQGARLALVAFPFEPQLRYRNDGANRSHALLPQRKLHELCERYDVPCLDLYEPFAQKYDLGRVLFADEIHLNPEGHQLTAELVLDFLASESPVFASAAAAR